MESEGYCRKIQSKRKDCLSSLKRLELIRYQETLFNVRYRNGKWIRRYNGKKKQKSRSR
jgi:hypothetical protein